MLQCTAAAAKARRALFQLKAAVSCKEVEVFIPLYCSFVRPHLEYCLQAWAPFLRKDVILLEKVQRLATRMVKGTKGMTYPERLRFCDLFSLERRRLRGDLMEAFRIIRGSPDRLNRELLSVCTESTTRGHNSKSLKPRTRLDIPKYSFGY